MNNLTVKQLRYLEALARHGHFGRAAEACAISQPALSMQIRELEETLGAALFERGARQVRLTSFGEEFALRVRDVLRSVDELGDLARTSGDRLVGRLRIGIIPTIAPYLLPAIVGGLTRKYAGLDIHVRETVTPKLIQELADGRLDTAIVALPVSEPSFAEVALFAEDFVLVRRARMRASRRPMSKHSAKCGCFCSKKAIVFAIRRCRSATAIRRCPASCWIAVRCRPLVQMVGAGIGVTLIPEMAVAVETRSAQVSVARFRDPKPSRTIGMIWRKTSPLAKQLLQISDVVRQSTEALRRQQKPATSSRKARGGDGGHGNGTKKPG